MSAPNFLRVIAVILWFIGSFIDLATTTNGIALPLLSMVSASLFGFAIALDELTLKEIRGGK